MISPSDILMSFFGLLFMIADIAVKYYPMNATFINVVFRRKTKLDYSMRYTKREFKIHTVAT